MNFPNFPSEIDAQLRPQYNQMMSQIHSGQAPEPLIKQFIREIHNSWVTKASEYVRRLEEMRRGDREEYEQKIRDLRAALNLEREENRAIQAQFSIFLIKIGEMQRDQEKFYNVQGGALIESSGRFITALSNLLDRHVEVIEESDNKALMELRNKCQEIVSEQNSKIKDILHWDIYSKLPIRSICINREEIESDIRKIEKILSKLENKVVYLTPDFWEEENLQEINNLKAGIEQKVGNLLKLLGEAEANHKRKLQQEMVFNPRNALSY